MNTALCDFCYAAAIKTHTYLLTYLLYYWLLYYYYYTITTTNTSTTATNTMQERIASLWALALATSQFAVFRTHGVIHLSIQVGPCAVRNVCPMTRCNTLH